MNPDNSTNEAKASRNMVKASLCPVCKQSFSWAKLSLLNWGNLTGILADGKFITQENN